MVRSRIAPLLFSIVLAGSAFGQTSLVGHYLNHADPLRISDIVAAPEIDRVFGVTEPPSVAFLAWRLSTFPAGVQANSQPLLPTLFTFDPSDPNSGWSSFLLVDGIHLLSFDYDTRGNVYLSYSINGFGVVNSTGQLLSQISSEATTQIKVLQSGGVWYALVLTASGTRVYDVTNPSAPVLVRTITLPFTSIAVAGDRAAVTNNIDIRFFDVPTLLTGGAPLQTITGTPYSKVVTDGARFFSTALTFVSGHAQTTLTMFTPVGASYLASTTTIIDRFPVALRYGGGAVALTLRTPSNQGLAVLYTVEGAALVPHSLNLPTTPLNAVDVFIVGAQHYLVTTERVTGELYTLSSAIFANAGATDIPTTTEWGLLLILVTLGAIAVMRLRG